MLIKNTGAIVPILYGPRSRAKRRHWAVFLAALLVRAVVRIAVAVRAGQRPPVSAACNRAMSVATEIGGPRISQEMAGAPGFEPGNGGTKNRCLTAWLRPNAAGPFHIACARRRKASTSRSTQKVGLAADTKNPACRTGQGYRYFLRFGANLKNAVLSAPCGVG